MKMYNYGGQVKDNLLLVNTADLKANSIFGASNIDIDNIDNEDLKISISKIRDYISKNNIGDELTLSDPRLVFAYYKIMLKYPNAVSANGLTEWFVCYTFFKDFYDKSVMNIDNIIYFLNLYIGNKFTSSMGESDRKDLAETAGALQPFDYTDTLPKFVIDAIQEGYEYVPTIIEKPKSDVEQPNVDLTKSDYSTAIAGLNIMAKFAKGQEKKDLQNAIKGMVIMMGMLPDDSANKMEKGGQVIAQKTIFDVLN
jgi:hypothetical protein